MWACRVIHKYYTIITTLSSDPLVVSNSTCSLLSYPHITLIIVNTTVQHADLPVYNSVSPYVVVIKWRWKDSTSSDIWYQNTPHFPNISLARSLDSMCIWNSRLMPAWSLTLWSWSFFNAHRMTPSNPPCVFHNLGVPMAVRGVELSLPYPRSPRIDDMYALNFYMIIDC